MKNLILTFNMLKRFIPQCLLLVVEIVFTLILITTLINTYQWEMKEYNAFQHKEFNNAIYFSGKFNVSNKLSDKNVKEMMQYLNSQKEFNGISDIDHFSFATTTNGAETYFDIYTADRNTCKILNIDEAQFFDEEKIKKGTLPCVIISKEKEIDSNGFSLGKKINGNFYNVTYYSAEEEALSFDASLEIVKIENNPSFIYPRYIAKVSGDFSYTNITNYTKLNKVTIFVPKIEELFGGYEEAPFWILLNENTNEERKNEILDNVKKYGYASTKQGLDKETLIGTNYRLQRNIKNTAMLCLLSILGLFTLSFLSVKQLFKRFSIYYFCGCTKGKSIRLYAMLMSFVGVLSIIVYYIITIFCFYFPLNYAMELDFYKYESLNATGAISILLCFALISLFSLIPFIFNYKRTSFEMYRL